MRIAVCVKSGEELALLRKWVGQYCGLYDIDCYITSFHDPEEFFEQMRGGAFQMAFVGLGGMEGFMMARRLRETDRSCAIVVIDDTAEFAVKCVRLHVRDYIVRPVEFKKVARAMKLALMEVKV